MSITHAKRDYRIFTDWFSVDYDPRYFHELLEMHSAVSFFDSPEVLIYKVLRGVGSWTFARCSDSPHFPVLDAWVAGRFTLAVSTGILLEYEEVIPRMSGREHWHKFARLMDYVELTTRANARNLLWG